MIIPSPAAQYLNLKGNQLSVEGLVQEVKYCPINFQDEYQPRLEGRCASVRVMVFCSSLFRIALLPEGPIPSELANVDVLL